MEFSSSSPTTRTIFVQAMPPPDPGALWVDTANGLKVRVYNRVSGNWEAVNTEIPYLVVNNSSQPPYPYPVAMQVQGSAMRDGLLLPRKTTAEIDALVGVPDGTLIFNTTIRVLMIRADGIWRRVSAI